MTVRPFHAAARALVRLPDGQTGRLVGVTRTTRMATVLVEGRHRRLPARMVTPIGEENPADTTGVPLIVTDTCSYGAGTTEKAGRAGTPRP